MSNPNPNFSPIVCGQAAPVVRRMSWKSLLTALLVYCSTVSVSVAAAAAMVSGLSAEVLLASF